MAKLSATKAVDALTERSKAPIVQTKVQVTPGFEELMAARGFDLSFVKF